MKRLFLIILLFLAAYAPAKFVAVLETGAQGEARERVSMSDRLYLTNVLREEAVKVLPAEQNYTIMTRENISAMLPPGKSIEECEGTCLAETGRNISADYVCQAVVGSFGGELTLSAELYETAGNKLVASFNGGGNDVKELLALIRAKTPDFFNKIKSTGDFSSSGIGEIGDAGKFSYKAKKKYIVQISSKPSKAIPTVDGRAIPKCVRTPCKVQLEEGEHRIVMSKDRYDDAESIVNVKANKQKIHMNLSPSYGWLAIKPAGLMGKYNVKSLRILVDEKPAKLGTIELDPGIHEVKITHPCTDPVTFKVGIQKGKKETFDKPLVRGVGGLELNAEYEGEPQAVAVYVNGKDVGSTPFAGEVPLCTKIAVGDTDWTENVSVNLKWHEVVQVTHVLQHKAGSVSVMDRADSTAQPDDTKLWANESDAERDGKSPDEAKNIPANVDNSSGGVHWVPLSISFVTAATGVVLAVVGNSQAKAAREKGFDSKSEYKKNKNAAHDAQTLRSVGIGLAIAGAVGIGLSIAF